MALVSEIEVALTRTLTLDQWKAIGRKLGALQSALNWVIGAGDTLCVDCVWSNAWPRTDDAIRVALVRARLSGLR